MADVPRKEKDSGLRCIFEGGGEGSVVDLAIKKEKVKDKDISDDDL